MDGWIDGWMEDSKTLPPALKHSRSRAHQILLLVLQEVMPLFSDAKQLNQKLSLRLARRRKQTNMQALSQVQDIQNYLIIYCFGFLPKMGRMKLEKAMISFR